MTAPQRDNPNQWGPGYADPETFPTIRRVIEGKLHTGEVAVVKFRVDKSSRASSQAE